MLPMEELGVQVRPVFLDQVRGAVEANLGEPALSGLSPGALLAGVVEIRNSRCCAVPDYFGHVGGTAIPISAGDE